MSSFDIESVWKRFLIALVGGLVVIGVFYFIIHSAISSGSSTDGQYRVPWVLRQVVANSSLDASTGQAAPLLPGKQKHVPNPSPVAFPSGVDSDSPAVPPNLENLPAGIIKTRLVVVANSSTFQALESAGAFFPKDDSWVRVREMVSDSSVRLTGLPDSENDFYNPPVDDTKHFTAGRLPVSRNFTITVRNNRLSVSGYLTRPMLLTFESQLSQPVILLWPAGCEAVFDSKCDDAGNISLNGGGQVLDMFANIINNSTNPAVRLSLSLPASGSTTNLPVAGLQYEFRGVAAAKAQAKEKDVVLKGQMVVLEAFKKLFQAAGSTGGTLPFWQELDQKCQLITQGRLGLINYDFSGDAVARSATCQMVLADLSNAPNLTTDLKNLAQATLTEDNLTVMAAIDDRIAWGKNLAIIASQLNAGRQKLQPSATLSVVAEFRYAAVDNQVAGSEMLLGRLAFNAAPSALPVSASSNARIQQINQINAQIQRLDFKIFELESKYIPSTATTLMKAKYVSELSKLESQRRSLQTQLLQFR